MKWTGFAIWVLGTLLLLTNSEITDIAFALVSIGGLMTIWFKLGTLEATTKIIELRLSKLEECVDTLKSNVTMLQQKTSRGGRK
ncbi:MAG: hypothetical protein QXY83_00100 [Thermosphaera sp.]